MYVSHTAMPVAGIGIALPCAIPTSSLFRKLARPAAFRHRMKTVRSVQFSTRVFLTENIACRAIRGKRLAGGASPSTDFIHHSRTSVPNLSAQMLFCCVSTLFARGVKGAERTTLPASVPVPKLSAQRAPLAWATSLPYGKHRR